MNGVHFTNRLLKRKPDALAWSILVRGGVLHRPWRKWGVRVLSGVQCNML